MQSPRGEARGRGPSAAPIGQRRHVQIDALARVDAALPVERHVRGEFAEQNFRQQMSARTPARDRMRRGRCLHDRIASPAGAPLTHGDDHLSARRQALQALGDVLSELAEPRFAAARADCRCRMYEMLTRGMLRQRPPRTRDDLETRRAALSRHSADLLLPDLDRRLSSPTIPTWQDGRRRTGTHYPRTTTSARGIA